MIASDVPGEVESASAMHDLGLKLADCLSEGGVLALIGELGSGKTQLTKGIVEGFGYQEEVTSPTFSIVHEYRGKGVDLFHFDWYRLEGIEDLEDVGWSDYLDKKGLCIVEWANLFPGALPVNTHIIKIERKPLGRGLTYGLIDSDSFF